MRISRPGVPDARPGGPYRAGFTLIEVLISMVLLLFVIGVASTSFRRTSVLLAQQSGRLEAQQTAQFALAALDRELRVAGVGVVDMQPVVVQAAPNAITFNADLVSSLAGDPSAVYVDPEAQPEVAAVYPSSAKRPLPNSPFEYPESTFVKAGGVRSGAETISYWIASDSSDPSGATQALWRRVNAGAARLVARGIVVGPTDTVFQFFKGDSAGNLTAVPASKLPLYHVARTHGAMNDTGKFAIIDSIHTVRVRMRIAYRDRNGVVQRRLDHTIRLMNAGLVQRVTCGEAPLGVTATALASVDTLGQPIVTISWTQSGDEVAGEKDVERYVLYRRPGGAPAGTEEPFNSIPAGAASYAFVDTDVASGEVWIYSVAAQDCTPNTSGAASTGAVVIP